MKKSFFLFLSFLFIASVFAQAPEKVSYQAVIRDGSNALVSNSTVGIRISILQGTIFGASVYVETHTATTNANGLATLEIGTGSVVVGNFTTIDWANGPYFLKTETDPAGGSAYSITGTTELISVPYAFYSNHSAESDHAFVADSLAGFSGTGTSAPFDRAYIYLRKKATIQSVPSAATTQITNYDIVNSNDFTVNMTTGVITFQRTGYYMITVQTSFDSSSPGRKLVWLNCTSSNWPARIASNEMSGDANRITTSFMGLFNAGDQLSLGVQQFTGVTVDCPSNTLTFDQTYVSIEMLFE